MGTGLLTDTGFDPKRLVDVLADLQADFRAQFGQSLNLGADTPEGKLVGILSATLTDLWELAESLYNSRYPGGASGVDLDRLAEITGITRLAATRSTVIAYLRGALATVPLSSLVEVVDAGNQFRTLAAVVLGAAHELTDPAAGGALVQSAGTATQTYTTHGFLVGDYVWYIGLDQAEYNGVHEVLTVPTANTFTFAVDSGAVSPATGTATAYEAYPVAMEAVLTGPTPALAGTLTEIVNPVSGWDGVTNALDAVVGRDEETDAEFRVRRLAALQGLGNATPDAIRGDLLSLSTVLSVTVFENNTDVTDGSGRPPHSIECLIDGGVDADIAQAIWDSKAAGIATYGTSSANATDDQGGTHLMYFSRPADVEIYLDLTLTVDSNYPVDGDAQVEAAVLAWAATLDIGEDVVVFPLLISSFAGVPGITDVVVDIGTSPAPSGDANIVIAETERAKFDSTRTTVTS